VNRMTKTKYLALYISPDGRKWTIGYENSTLSKVQDEIAIGNSDLTEAVFDKESYSTADLDGANYKTDNGTIIINDY